MKKADVIALVKYHSVIIIWTLKEWLYVSSKRIIKQSYQNY